MDYFLTYFLLNVKLGSFFHCKSLPICNSFVMVRVKFLEIYHHYILPSVPPSERDHFYTLGSETISISTFNIYFKFLLNLFEMSTILILKEMICIHVPKNIWPQCTFSSCAVVPVLKLLRSRAPKIMVKVKDVHFHH